MGYKYEMVKGLGLIKIEKDDTPKEKPDTEVLPNVKRVGKSKQAKGKVENNIPSGTSKGG